MCGSGYCLSDGLLNMVTHPQDLSSSKHGIFQMVAEEFPGARDGNHTSQGFCKLLFVSHLLIFQWPKQDNWPSINVGRNHKSA